MVIFNFVQVKGTDFSDNVNSKVFNTLGEDNSSSTFESAFDNFNGEHKDSFSVGDEVSIFSEKDVDPPTTKIFSGIVEEINFRDQENNQGLVISGRDFTQRLMDTTVEPSVFTNQEVSTIVTAIMADVKDITVVNVNVTTTTLQRISFSHLPVFDAIKQLAELSGFTFYVDVDKDLHFEKKGGTSSGVTIDNTNALLVKVQKSDQGLFNNVFVYGGRQLTGKRESFVPDGGSIFTLENNPHNTQVVPAGSVVPARGAILNQITTPPSNTDYLVNFDDKQVIFVSGTEAGDNLPSSGIGSLVIDYDKSSPIIKFGENKSSVAQFGVKRKVIQDKNINDPLQAKEQLLNELDRNSSVRIQINCKLDGVSNLIAGNTIFVNLPDENIVNQTFDILKVTYNFTQENALGDTVISVVVSRKIADITDTMKQMLLDIRQLQAQDLEVSDVISRLEVGAGSVGVRVKSWTINTSLTGSDWYLGSPAHPNGFVGSPGSFFIGSHTVTQTFQISGGEA